ncbi:MAG: prepilin-type N-terminal cleavage/methylation domain-containing protein [Gammaproteobacteria bacterium]|nr:prepilin-type N-terminal cleavage/methylation domain-containing protein [Gammaproteobacteria bacterium]
MAVSHPVNTQSGFTLIETLVAITVLTVGMLSISMNLTLGLKSRIDTEIHSEAMQVTAQYVEPLSIAAGSDLERFRDLIMSLNTVPAQSRYQVSINSVHDAKQVDLRDAPSGSWEPPFTLVMNVAYRGKNNLALNFPTTHVFVP